MRRVLFDGEDDLADRRRAEATLDARVLALLRVLEEWLPPDVAWDRAMNAAAPLLLLEHVDAASLPYDALDPRKSIALALANQTSMHGIVVPEERIEQAVRAWNRASRISGIRTR